MLHKLLARSLPADFLVRHLPYFDYWQTRRLPGVPVERNDLLEALQLLNPIGCSSELIRIGGTGDGSYLVPDDLDGVEACFSPGVGDKIQFETDLASRFGTCSYLCDPSVEASSLQLNPALHILTPKWLGDYDDSSTHSLNSWVRETGLHGSNSLILQIDIEGGEYHSLMFASNSVLRCFRIVVMELHGLGDLGSSRFLNNKFMPLMLKLNSIFDLVHIHPNNACGTTDVNDIKIPKVVELTFWRKDRNLRGKQAPIPHPLDILNRPDKPALLPGFPAYLFN